MTESGSPLPDDRERMSRLRMFTSIAWLFGQRSTCTRAQVGAIAVRGGRILASGYVGSVSGQPHCLDVGCEIENGGCIRTVHAEANVVAWAAREGISLEGCTVYCTHSPCLKCAQLLVNAGVSSFHFVTKYRDERGLKLLTEHIQVVDNSVYQDE